jgi:hypothetical protein
MVMPNLRTLPPGSVAIEEGSVWIIQPRQAQAKPELQATFFMIPLHPPEPPQIEAALRYQNATYTKFGGEWYKSDPIGGLLHKRIGPDLPRGVPLPPPSPRSPEPVIGMPPPIFPVGGGPNPSRSMGAARALTASEEAAAGSAPNKQLPGPGPGPKALPAPTNASRLGIDLEKLTPTQTVSGHAAQRPYINSPNTIQNIVESGMPRPDPGGVAGALRWDVPGSFNGSVGTFELVIDPATNRILHFLFRSGG